ncbi:MAG: ABC-type transport auxiliary lipoprotein family protein, partial [Mariprofundus sp.]|nr:ABC-type transport auxiliary lipoprotein family protein [Mariprofundus sp.]
FERLADGYVHLNVRWVLQRSGNDTQNYYLRLQSDEVVKDKDYGAIAAAMSHLVGKLSDNMAQVILAIASEEHE